jgi:hypothetical protein
MPESKGDAPQRLRRVEPHAVRGAIAGALKKKLGLDVASEKDEKRGRVYDNNGVTQAHQQHMRHSGNQPATNEGKAMVRAPIPFRRTACQQWPNGSWPASLAYLEAG